MKPGQRKVSTQTDFLCRGAPGPGCRRALANPAKGQSWPGNRALSRCRNEAETEPLQSGRKCTLCIHIQGGAFRSPRSRSCHSPSPVRRLGHEFPAQPWAEARLELISCDSKLSRFSVPQLPPINFRHARLGKHPRRRPWGCQAAAVGQCGPGQGRSDAAGNPWERGSPPRPASSLAEPPPPQP